MKIISKILTFCILLTSFSACDEGRLYEDTIITSQEGIVVKVRGDFRGIGSWADGYQLVVAGFSDSDYADITKEITSTEVILSGVPENVNTIEICAINRLRKRIVTFESLNIDSSQYQDTLRWDVGKCGGSMFDGIQLRVFDTTCANCHGASNHAAAGLYLTAGRSYDAIVNKGSKVMGDNDTIVIPGNADRSLIYRMLSTDITSSWAYDHSVEIVDQSMLDMISAWIDNNAKR